MLTDDTVHLHLAHSISGEERVQLEVQVHCLICKKIIGSTFKKIFLFRSRFHRYESGHHSW